MAADPPNLVAIYADGYRTATERFFSRRKLLIQTIRQELLERWQRRQLSNFDYIMELNALAGRSYNDITQYPVLPWVLTDYSSPELNLETEETFRDLSKPVGALNAARAARFRERYENFDDPEIPKFHYGSHYSSAGTVLYYMLRVEPFTSLAIALQGGRFDVADRLFGGVRSTFEGCLDSMADVKELTPEWFYCPEMFINTQGFELGYKQTGEKLDHVQLPPWARNAHDFVVKHREALESDYVSEHLHEWVNLVFGYQQRGPAAVEAQNVFYYLTYEGAVDMESVTDEQDLQATEDQIRFFGCENGESRGRNRGACGDFEFTASCAGVVVKEYVCHFEWDISVTHKTHRCFVRPTPVPPRTGKRPRSSS